MFDYKLWQSEVKESGRRWQKNKEKHETVCQIVFLLLVFIDSNFQKLEQLESL